VAATVCVQNGVAVAQILGPVEYVEPTVGLGAFVAVFVNVLYAVPVLERMGDAELLLCPEPLLETLIDLVPLPVRLVVLEAVSLPVEDLLAELVRDPLTDPLGLSLGLPCDTVAAGEEDTDTSPVTEEDGRADPDALSVCTEAVGPTEGVFNPVRLTDSVLLPVCVSVCVTVSRSVRVDVLDAGMEGVSAVVGDTVIRGVSDTVLVIEAVVVGRILPDTVPVFL
jgi:hypothetical protein